MGVDLGELFPATPAPLDSLKGKTIAIDAYNALYQFLAIIRGPDGTPLRDDQGRVTSHLNGLLNRTVNLAGHGIAPIYVFDGAPHPLKLKTLEERKRIREAAQKEYEEALAAGDLERARSKAQQTTTLSKEMVEQAKRLLRALGVPVIQAPSEGEAQASSMARAGKAYACGSQDFDSLLFGAPHLLRNLAATGRRKLPGKQAYVDVEPTDIDLDAGLATHALTRPQLIDVALLVGTDYNPGVIGIGPKTALKLVKEAGSLEAALERAPRESGAAWKKVEAGRDGLADAATVRSIFLEPVVDADPAIEWGRLDRAAVMHQLVDGHRFSRERVEASLDKLKEAPFYGRQKTITDWF